MIERPFYLNKMIRKSGNGMIKIITGIRRCGKLFLLFNIFYEYLKSQGVPDNHIIRIALDDPIRQNRWKSFIKKKKALVNVSLEEVTEFLKKFIGPIIDAIATNTPYEKQWRYKDQNCF